MSATAIDVDLLTIIAKCLKELCSPFKAKWIKAHQDRVASYDQLPLAARLNIDADFLATRYRFHGKLKTSSKVDHVPDQQLSVSLNGLPLLSNFDERIRFHVNGYHHKQYVQECNEWNEKTWTEVDFRTLGPHLKCLSPSHRSQHIKFIHDLLPLGVKRFREAPIPTEALKLCPRCRTATETPLHFLQCPDDALHSSLSQLRKDLWTDDIHPVRYLIYDGVHHWSTGTSTPFNPDLSQFSSHLLPCIVDSLRSQSTIGWHQTIKGYLSTHWTTLASLSMEPTIGQDANASNRRIKSILR